MAGQELEVGALFKRLASLEAEIACLQKVQVHLPEHCAVCGREIAVGEAHEVIGKRQEFDLPEPRPGNSCPARSAGRTHR